MGMARQCNAGAADAAVPVLLTRPEAEAQGFAKALVRRFEDRVRPVVAPLMAVEYLAPGLPPGPFDGVVFTSAAGVEGATRLRADLPGLAWCVGTKTAARAQSAGFRARSADGDADALVSAILADPPAGRLLHLRGEDSRGAVAERLFSAGIETVSAIVYRQVPQSLTAAASALLQMDEPVIVPLFSPRSARLFAAQVPSPRAALHLVVMSGAVAEAAHDIPARSTTQATRPDAGAMLDAIELALMRIPAP